MFEIRESAAWIYLGRSGRGRPREFDEQEAVQNPLEVFRARGYTATSLPDLIEGTQFSRGSLYN